MSYGTLNQTQQKALAPYINGRWVTDLGAGDLKLALQLLRLGAAYVIAVDREPLVTRSKRIVTVTGHFDKVPSTLRLDVAFLSWPPNWSCQLEPLLERAAVVIYLGKNTDGTACGTPDLFRCLATREVLSYVPDPKNTLVVYGPNRLSRALMGEEYAAIHQNRVFAYDQVEPVAEDDEGTPFAEKSGIRRSLEGLFNKR